MGVFDDHKLEKLDWMTAMTETIESHLNDLLSRLPDRTLVSPQAIIEASSSSYLSFSVRSAMHELNRQHQREINYYLSYEEERLLLECFEFQVTGEPELDLRTGTLTGGTIEVVKIKNAFSDEELQPIMGQRGLEELGRGRDYTGPDAPFERMNEILDILGGCQEALSSRSGKKKINAIRDRLKKIFTTNEWRIRDMALADKVGKWVKGYISEGNLADLTNLCKLKVMTHNNMPIYSVKEEQ